MSSREPMWYCHECNAEMRPLMMPDPHCASCRGTFVEKIENPQDDPRQFHAADEGLDEGLGPFALLAGLNEFLRAESPTHTTGHPDRNRTSSSPPRDRSGSPTRNMGLRFEFGGPNGRRTFVLGGQNVLNRTGSDTNASANTPDAPPRLSEFLRANSTSSNADTRDTHIPGAVMAQYLMALLGGGGARGMSPFFGPGMGDERGPGEGRWGDYVFTQEALDQIITQMMEGANSTRPVPASEETVEKLPREVVEEGSPLLEKDCAVCKEQFNAKPEDPEEQIAVSLPCKHSFHENCIVPWLKSSGTCPVCRFALVPQPNAGPGPPGSSTEGRPGSSDHNNNPGSGGSNSSSGSGSGSHTGGFFSSLFGGHSSHSRGGSTSDRHTSSRSGSHSTSPTRDRQHRQGSRGNNDGHRIPGSWGESLD